MKFPSLQAWLTWLESIHPTEIDLGLERIKRVAQAMSLQPAPFSKIITVAGTNGKGSCIATLESILAREGKTFGSYTSPHLVYYNERIRLQGKPVSDQLICEAFEAINTARGETTLTYFEFGTLAACYIMQQAQVDYWLLEVGLGGRLDAVNTFDADIAIITSIDIDHTEWLGDTREDIGREKAGIVRHSIPVVCAERDLPCSVVEVFTENTVQHYQVGQSFDYGGDESGFRLRLVGDKGIPVEFSLPQAPDLPHGSVVAAIQALLLAGELANLDKPYLTALFDGLQLAGRFQRITWKGKEIILDVAHNPAAVKSLSHKIAQEKRYADKPLCAVLGMMKDKLHYDALKPLVPFIDHWYLGDLAHMPRAAKGTHLHEVLRSLNVPEAKVSMLSSIPEAFATATDEHERVLVFGSFYTLAEVYPVIG